MKPYFPFLAFFAVAALFLLALGFLAHRYEFHPASNGFILYRCDRLTGTVTVLNLSDRNWIHINDAETLDLAPASGHP